LLRNKRASIFSRYQLGSLVKRSTCITRNLTYVAFRSTCVQPTRYGLSANRRYGLAVISPSRGQRQKPGQKRALSASGVGRRSPKLCPFLLFPQLRTHNRLPSPYRVRARACLPMFLRSSKSNNKNARAREETQPGDIHYTDMSNLLDMSV